MPNATNTDTNGWISKKVPLKIIPPGKLSMKRPLCTTKNIKKTRPRLVGIGRPSKCDTFACPLLSITAVTLNREWAILHCPTKPRSLVVRCYTSFSEYGAACGHECKNCSKTVLLLTRICCVLLGTTNSLYESTFVC